MLGGFVISNHVLISKFNKTLLKSIHVTHTYFYGIFVVFKKSFKNFFFVKTSIIGSF